MDEGRNLCLVSNTASGSYSADALEALTQTIRDSGLDLRETVCFPQDPLPTIDSLSGSKIDILAMFTGDGTINRCVTGLYGWDGAVLALPGGTMNLLSHRLHGEATADEIIARVAGGHAKSARYKVARSRHGDALVGYSAGPAATWYNVREVMREVDIRQMIEEANEALTKTMAEDSMLCIRDPEIGDPQGYPLVEIVPTDAGLRLVAYNPRTLGDYIAQGWKMMVRRFREGPHEVLGHFERLVLADASGAPIVLSIDGEPSTGEPVEVVTLAQAEVDLLATVS